MPPTNEFAEKMAQALNLLGAISSAETYRTMQTTHSGRDLETLVREAVHACSESCQFLSSASENRTWRERCELARPYLEEMQQRLDATGFDNRVRELAGDVLEALSLAVPQ